MGEGPGVFQEGTWKGGRRRDFEDGRRGGVRVAWDGGIRLTRRELDTGIE